MTTRQKLYLRKSRSSKPIKVLSETRNCKCFSHERKRFYQAFYTKGFFFHLSPHILLVNTTDITIIMYLYHIRPRISILCGCLSFYVSTVYHLSFSLLYSRMLKSVICRAPQRGPSLRTSVP